MNALNPIRYALAVAAFGMAASASATTITYDPTNDASSVRGATTVDFNNGCGYAACSGNYAIVTGGASGLYAPPGNDSTPYLTVPQNLNDNPVSADFSLGRTANYFGLLWGSIDSYNSLSFLLNGTEVASYSGSDLLAPTGTTYVNFFDLPIYDAVRVTSTQYAFESDNHAYALIGDDATDVPEPGSLALLGAGLVGLIWGVRRRNPSIGHSLA